MFADSEMYIEKQIYLFTMIINGQIFSEKSLYKSYVKVTIGIL